MLSNNYQNLKIDRNGLLNRKLIEFKLCKKIFTLK